jgi:hypothetical protein
MSHYAETTEKPQLVSALCRRSEVDLASVFSISRRLLLCGVGAQGGCDRVEVDEDGGPDGLER